MNSYLPISTLEAVVVAGEREGSALAITQQRNAPNVKNVLSADAFGNVADENIGNFLLRVPGISANIQEGEITGLKIRGSDPDMNAVTVDGTRAADGSARTGLNRGFAIDTIPASFVDSIEVTKAPTPDMDADAIGGSVNLRTKTSLSAGTMTAYRVGTSYHTGRETWSPQGNLVYSHVFGKERKFGMMMNLNFSWTVTPHDVVFGAWEPTLDTTRPAWYGLTTAGDDYFERKRGTARTAEPAIRLDAQHASSAGKYLGACVWFEFFFKEDVRKVRFKPDDVEEEFATALRAIAHRAVTGREKPKIWPAELSSQ